MNNIPICDCFGEVVKSSASGKEFWYCRSCKKEVLERPSLEISYLPLECVTDNFVVEDHFSPIDFKSTMCPDISWINQVYTKEYWWDT